MTKLLDRRAPRIARPAPSILDGHADRVAMPAADTHAHRSEVIPSLDGIRAISVSIVVVGHSGLQALVPGGLGVTIFFFLSGYLISTLLLTEHARTGGINIANFYARRVFRLMPPLIVSLAVAYGLTYSGLLAGGITAKGLAAQLLYFANYYGLFFDPGNTIPDGTGILWSLAVEEHFYIVYPLLMALLLGSALRPRTIGTLLGIACLVVLAWRIHLVHSPDFVSDRTYYASDTRIDSIIYGCILAVVMNPHGLVLLDASVGPGVVVQIVLGEIIERGVGQGFPDIISGGTVVFREDIEVDRGVAGFQEEGGNDVLARGGTGFFRDIFQRIIARPDDERLPIGRHETILQRSALMRISRVNPDELAVDF